MKLLFLDTETSGVDCNKDQIIEIGAVVFELDNYELKLVDYFQTTVSLRKVLDERITRITGITETELTTAPSLVKAQTLYNNWLEKYENDIIGIVGHSIEFDIGFLKKEGWFLPTQKFYDTLDLAKIILPNMQAVNLEFLSKKIGFGNILKGIPDNGLSYHRALYDSIMCANLFEFILKQINILECSQLFVDRLSELFLPKGISFYKSTKIEVIKDSVETKDKIKTEIEFTGMQKNIGINDKIKTLKYSENIENMLIWNLPKDLEMIILQLYVISIWNSIKPTSHNIFLKLHSLGLGFWWANFAMELLLEKNFQSQGVLIYPENIIDQINKIADQSINFETIANYFGILEKVLVHNAIADQNIFNWLSQYEFFLITFQPFLSNYEYKINFVNLLHTEKNVAQKFTVLIQSLKNLGLPNLSQMDSYPILKIVLGKIQSFIDEIEFVPNSIYTFKMIGNRNLFVSKFNPGFNVNSHYQAITTKIQSVVTNLNETDYNELLGLANIEANSISINYKSNHKYRITDGISRQDFLIGNIETAKVQNKPIFIICGQNSSLKNLTKAAADYDLMDNILIIGESGGITKIASKVDQGFVGVVVFKFSSVDYFYSLHRTPELAKIVLYDRPYFYINEFWYNHSKSSKKYSPDVFLKILKDIFIQGKINSLNNKFGCDVELSFNLF
jgi:DNA polymerase III epsilon subunit-like protein